MGKLDGKTAIVTGSGRGIGRAIALKLVGDGARVVVNDLDEAPAAAVAAEITAAGGDAFVLAGDVAATYFGARLVAATLDRFGGLDILVNNAGYIWNTTIQNNTDEQWYAMVDVHATAPFRILRAAAGYFRDTAKRERVAGAVACRKVVNISSVSAVFGAATQLSYAAGKGAVIGITRALAREWGRYNVTVNCVAFGLIETRLTQRLDAGPQTIEVHGQAHKVGLLPDQQDLVRQLTPLGRGGTPEDAAGAVYLLCIPESDYITGQLLVCGGGLTT